MSACSLSRTTADSTYRIERRESMLKTPQKRTEAEMFSVGDRIEVVREGQLVDLATVRPATERMTPKAGLVDSLRRSTGSILGRIALEEFLAPVLEYSQKFRRGKSVAEPDFLQLLPEKIARSYCRSGWCPARCHPDNRLCRQYLYQ